jgi:hypothetical protein
MQNTFFQMLPKKALAGIALCLLLFSFRSGGGVDGFKIYLNDKLILEQYVTNKLTIKDLQLTNANINDHLVIFYTHCGGVIGKGRSIAIKNDQGKILKEWKFEDVGYNDKGMSIPVRELLQLEKSNAGSHLNICYSAAQLPSGRNLAMLQP